MISLKINNDLDKIYCALSDGTISILEVKT